MITGGGVSEIAPLPSLRGAHLRQLALFNIVLFNFVELAWLRGQFSPDSGGEGEIRTRDRVAPMPVFKTGAFNRSATSPKPIFAPRLYADSSRSQA